MTSRRQKLWNAYARLVGKTVLGYLRPYWLMRRVLKTAGQLGARRPAGLVTTDRGHHLLHLATPAMHNPQGTLFYIHGGGFVAGDIPTYRRLAVELAERAGLACTMADYRLAPEHPYPVPLDDVEEAYAALSADPAAGPIVVAGDSAGGQLLFALLLRIRARGLPPPVACAALSPATDLRGGNPSLTRNRRSEVLLPPRLVRGGVAAYLGDTDPAQPELSPILGDFTGTCPVMIHVDRGEMLYDDSRLMADHLRAQGVEVALTEEEGLCHVWHINAGLTPEADASVSQIAAFFKTHVQAAKTR